MYIPCHANGRFLPQAIESVFNQSYSDWELIVIDDASTDETAEVARRFQEQRGDRIRIVRNVEAMSVVACANLAL